MKNIVSSLALISLLIGACDSNKEKSVSRLPADSVEVFALKKERVAKSLSLPAELLPWERVEVYARLEGYVRELRVDIGDQVRKNDVLVILDAPEVTANYAKSSADMQAAKSKYQTSLDLYRRTLEASQEKGTVSDSELESIRNRMLTDSASYQASKSGADAYSQLQKYLVVRAAFDGVITQRNVYPGTLVGRSETPMLVLENHSRFRLHVAVPETYTSSLPESPSVNFTVEAQPSKTYSATLARRSSHIDGKTRTELWEFEVVNDGHELKSGMYGNVSFNLRRDESSFVVPHSAIVTTLEKRFVIRVRDGRTEWVDVRSGISTNDRTEIFGDLQEGDVLLTKATDEFREAQKVAVKVN